MYDFITLNTKGRKEKTKEGLVSMLVDVLSDEDTSGRNGPEYLSIGAKRHFGIDLDADNWWVNYPDKDVVRFTDDNYLRELLLDTQTENEEALAWFAYSIRRAMCDEYTAFGCDYDGTHVLAVSFAVLG